MEQRSPAPVRATVVSGLCATEYLSLGAGRTVIVVVGLELEPAPNLPYDKDFRLLVLTVPAPLREACAGPPVGPAVDCLFANWLDAVAEGLGLPPFRLLVDSAFEGCARAFAAACPERTLALAIRDLSRPIDLPVPADTLARG